VRKPADSRVSSCVLGRGHTTGISAATRAGAPVRVVTAPESTSTPMSTPTRTVFKAQPEAPPAEPVVQTRAKQPTGVAEDFETWRLRKAQELPLEEIPPVTPEPAKTEPVTPTEDFETWRKRKLEEEGEVVPSKPADAPGKLAQEVERTPEGAFPWRNAKLEARWETVDRRMMSIAGRTAGALVASQGLGDLYREFIGASKFDFDFNLAYIPADFEAEKTEFLDVEYMRKLFQLGHDMAFDGYPWEKYPPGLDPSR